MYKLMKFGFRIYNIECTYFIIDKSLINSMEFLCIQNLRE